MSQKYLRDLAVVPRSGFVYKDKDTNKIISAGTFKELVKKVTVHRKANELKTDATIVDSIHEYLCNNNPSDFCAEGFRGLGDVVHAIAHPIAELMDATLGTNIKGCGGCARRREFLNQAVGFRH